MTEPVAQYGIPSPPPEPAARATTPRPAINRVLGSTSGNSEGNVRALLSIILTVAFCAFVFYAGFEFIHNDRQGAHDIVAAGFGALMTAFAGFTGFYVGKRNAETGG